MTEKQYNKLKTKLGFRNCPICNSQAIYCELNKVNIFSEDGQPVPFEEVEIPDKEYVEVECPTCSFVMKFNVKALFK